MLATAWRWLLVAALLLLFEAASWGTQQASRLLAAVPMWDLARELLGAVVPFAIFTLPLVLAERFWPGSDNPRRYLAGSKYWLLALIAAYASARLAAALSGYWHLQPLYAWKVGSDAPVWVIAAATLLSVFLFDALYYWFHRAQHRFAVLWRFHEVHHSIVHLNCINSYHHVLEEFLRLPVITLPLALLLQIDTPQLFLVSAFVAAWGQYIHSDTAVHLGRLHHLFGDNAYHRIHHSNTDRHFHKNFAAFFPVWDRLFGTYHAPVPAPLPAVGLSDVAPPASIVAYLWMPFAKHRNVAATSDSPASD
ncbi:sterol desaturase family protein [Arenimonas oryziterrae]|uniref:Fatty acid hydroxylase domain-containing protein n=1 Tax=Arenimonas oryziterrae DSM 21050 = YC6267 TaxID=1121015 RepID=A0A091AWQ4_9GAMM|nr:sterol desaturase family protein [Arenimonas oryziterrae]KFN43089.1 hypothetical protein N789_11035 [Arenimonas oryziterrae DSM 21050 = YC6267]